ncbi:hypothetical protein JHN59_05170 [Streptomyces sp. MBT49]|uniref:hypothetical protein n=1 Tax=Streptomyces sp. MBT49 TaxID=1488380 RepID=UPI00190B2A72|nr:hypothetical protein [Streptomyces sp. MBT49]MBK3624239.1 hypothetical protein [Streptomyces sp. MBT49]
MARRKQEKKRRPPLGMPKGIVLLATPEGWRHSVLTAEGGMLCGCVTGIPVDAGPAEARAAVAAMVVRLAHDFHEERVEVTWDPPLEPGSWTAQLTVAANTCVSTTKTGSHEPESPLDLESRAYRGFSRRGEGAQGLSSKCDQLSVPL